MTGLCRTGKVGFGNGHRPAKSASAGIRVRALRGMAFDQQGSAEGERMNAKHPYWPDLTDDEGDALEEWFNDTCGDCLEGVCHWGGEQSVRAAREARHGHEFADPTYGTCGCARHHNSVLARPFWRGHETPQGAALAWQAANASGGVELADDHA